MEALDALCEELALERGHWPPVRENTLWQSKYGVQLYDSLVRMLCVICVDEVAGGGGDDDNDNDDDDDDDDDDNNNNNNEK